MYLTTKEAAARLGVSVTVILRYHRQDRLPDAEYVREGKIRRLMIPEAVIDNFERKTRGRPRMRFAVVSDRYAPEPYITTLEEFGADCAELGFNAEFTKGRDEAGRITYRDDKGTVLVEHNSFIEPDN